MCRLFSLLVARLGPIDQSINQSINLSDRSQMEQDGHTERRSGCLTLLFLSFFNKGEHSEMVVRWLDLPVQLRTGVGLGVGVEF